MRNFGPSAGMAAMVVGMFSTACVTPQPALQAASTRDTSSLGSVPTGRLPEGVRPLGYQLTIEVDPRADGFAGKTSIAIALDEPASGIWLHGQDLVVTSIHAHHGETPVTATWTQRTEDGVARVEFAEPLPAGNASIHIEYTARFDHPLRGLYKVETGGLAYAFTQFEAISARLAFPSFDEPRFKTPFDITLVVPGDVLAAGNTPVDTAVRLPDGRQQIHFTPTSPLPTYLIAFAIGPLDVVPGSAIEPNSVRAHPIPFRGIAARGQGERLQYALANTAKYVAVLEDYFDIPYPYRKLDVVAVPDFSAGAMENVGLITFREWLLLLDPKTASEHQRRGFAYVMAHELAHQWFGNLVTMPWWNDIWLNEAFATWMGNKAVESIHPDYRIDLSSLASAHRAMQLDSLESARRIRQPVNSNDDIQNAFDTITYEKGGAVLAMFERWMGPERFRDGIRSYLRAHEEGTATADDLLAALDAVDDRDISTPFRSFLDQAGVPLVHASLACSGAEGTLSWSQERYFPLGSSGDPRQTWQIPMCVRLSGGTTCQLLAGESGQITLPECPRWWMPNDEGAGYYRFALADSDWEALRTRGFAKLSERGQITVVDSLFAAFEQGSADAQNLIPWFPKLVASPIRGVATAPMRPLRFMIEDAAPPALRPAVRRYAGELYRKRYRALGWRARASDSSDDKLLRESVIRFMVMDVRDADVRSRAARLGRSEAGFQSRRGGASLEPQLTGVALAAAVQESGPAFFDHLEAAFRKSSDANQRGEILSALGHAVDGELAARARALTLDPAVRINEIGRLLGPQLGNARTRADAWAWFRDNFDALAQRFGQRQLGRSPRYVSGFCSVQAADEVESFFAPRVEDLTGGPRNLATATEAIRLCSSLAEAQRPSVERAFESR
ncbi:MAG: M1 family aminopeptidase [Polyangiales bacterium]